MNKLHSIKKYGSLHIFLQSDAYQPLTDGDERTPYRKYNQKSYCEKTYTTDKGTYTRFRIWIYGTYNPYAWSHSYDYPIQGVDLKVWGKVLRFKDIKEEDVFEVQEIALDRFYDTITVYPTPLDFNKIPIRIDLNCAKLLSEHRYSFFICGNHDTKVIRKFFLAVFGESTDQYTDDELRDNHNYFLLKKDARGVQFLQNPDAIWMHVQGIFDRSFALPAIVSTAVEQINNL